MSIFFADWNLLSIDEFCFCLLVINQPSFFVHTGTLCLCTLQHLWNSMKIFCVPLLWICYYQSKTWTPIDRGATVNAIEFIVMKDRKKTAIAGPQRSISYRAQTSTPIDPGANVDAVEFIIP